MFGLLLTVLLTAADPVTAALESFSGIESYKVTLQSKGRSGAEVIKYSYKKPGLIRMDFVSPHKGAVLIYDPFKQEVLLYPFGSIRSFEMRLSPQNSLVKSSSGHTVDRSDIGSLLKNADALKRIGRIVILREEAVGARTATPVMVQGNDGGTVEGVNRYILWLDNASMLPLKVESFDGSNHLLEDVLMDDLELNPAFPEGFFTGKG